jgi:hypothetical protein
MVTAEILFFVQLTICVVCLGFHVTIPIGSIGIKYKFGLSSSQFLEGGVSYWYNPLIESIVTVDLRKQLVIIPSVSCFIIGNDSKLSSLNVFVEFRDVGVWYQINSNATVRQMIDNGVGLSANRHFGYSNKVTSEIVDFVSHELALFCNDVTFHHNDLSVLRSMSTFGGNVATRLTSHLDLICPQLFLILTVVAPPPLLFIADNTTSWFGRTPLKRSDTNPSRNLTVNTQAKQHHNTHQPHRFTTLSLLASTLHYFQIHTTSNVCPPRT